MTGPEIPPPSAEPEPGRTRPVRRVAVIGILAIVIGAVAGARVALRDDERRPPPDARDLRATGRSVAVDLSPLPAGLEREGEFRCAELRFADGSLTARAEGASIRNVSGGALRLGFEFGVAGSSQRQTVSKRFELPAGEAVPSVTMASKSLSEPVQRCALAFFLDEARPAEKVQAVAAAAKAAGCEPAVERDDEGNRHIQPPAKGRYRTHPPTSGDHYARPGPTGVHRAPIPDETQVHNLEHGHVGLQYRGIAAEAVEALEIVARADGGWVFAAPYPAMRPAVVLTAWRVSLECATAPADPEALAGLARAFVAAYKDSAPESIPGTPA